MICGDLPATATQIKLAQRLFMMTFLMAWMPPTTGILICHYEALSEENL